ncbi:MAG: carboxypeptidase-like regulatory domain-containing protein, partial [Bacteroidota bacterium]
MKTNLLVFLLALSWASYGQVRLTGKVTDENQQALPGVNILVKGTSQGTVTDSNGEYIMENVPGDATVIFSFIGYSAQEIAVSNQTSVNVRLLPDIRALEEVVVVGYGTQKKSVVTGAISSVKSDDLMKINTQRIDNAIQGQVAGVSVAATSNSPGASPQVVIRGIGTNGNYGPLYIIDGVQSGDMNHINPNDVESIEVLKDAASAAIYGTRGANGIIIVTTKKGKKGTATLNYDGYYGVQTTPKKMDLLNARDYVTLMREVATNDEVAPSPLLP